MYIGTHYNNYYNTLFGSRASALYSGMTASQLYQSGLSNFTGSYFNSELYQSSGLSYVQGLKSGSSALKSAVSALSNGSAFRQQSIVSSDDTVLTVSDAGSKYSATPAASSISVEQIAQGQVNEGTALNAQAVVGQSGVHTFAIEVGGKTQELSISVNAGDSNQTMQEKMAVAINGAGLGLTAKVGVTGGKSTLSISSGGIGDTTENRFLLSDVSGNAVARTGGDSVKQEAQNAIYRLNGGEAQTSTSNTVEIGGGYKATLKKASEGDVAISKGIDQENAMTKLNAFVEAYNSLYKTAAEQGDTDEKAYGLFKQMLSTTKTYLGSLTSLGVTFDEDGRMGINESVAKAALADGSAERFFTDGAGRNYGFAGQISNLADRVNRNTSQYVSQTALANSLTDSMNYLGYLGKSSRTNVNAMFDVGLLFDMWL